MKTFIKILLLAKNFLFPDNCALCGTSLSGATEINYSLCGECTSGLELSKDSACGICGKPLVSETDLCLGCRQNSKKPYERLWVLFPYTGSYRELLTQYKFKKKLALADFFAEKIKEALLQANIENACIVPVPPRPGKIKENGWDQVDYLVKRLKKQIQNPVSRCLKRKKSSVQKFLGRSQRIDNLKGRIVVHGVPPVTALVIDDVITTGSTMEICCDALKEGGAKKVYALCLFYD